MNILLTQPFKSNFFTSVIGFLFVALFLVLVIFNVTQGNSPHLSELNFIEKSYGNMGSVIPASCESNPNVPNGDGNFTGCNPFPTATLSANPTSILYGQSSVLTWSSTDATSCTGGGFNTGGATSGTIGTGPLTITTSYTLYCSSGIGQSSTQSATVIVNQPPIADAGIDRSILQPTAFTNPAGAGATDPEGAPVTVLWSTLVIPIGAPLPTIRNTTTLVPTFVNLTATGTYTFMITVTDNMGQTATDMMNVVVSPAFVAPSTPPTCSTPPCTAGGPPPTGEIRANGRLGSISIPRGSSANVTWSSDETTSCTVSPTGWTGTDNSVGNTVTPPARMVYVLICDGTNGVNNVAVSAVSINPQAASNPTISASPRIVRSGSNSTLSWNLNAQTGCTLSAGGTIIANEAYLLVNPSIEVQVVANTTYTLSCSAGSVSVSVEIIPIGFET